jgi:hypothetical protein
MINIDTPNTQIHETTSIPLRHKCMTNIDTPNTQIHDLFQSSLTTNVLY